MNCSHTLADFAPPPCGSCRNGCQNSLWEHMCLSERLAVPAGCCGPTKPQLQGHRRSLSPVQPPLWGLFFWAVGHPAAKQGPTAWGEHGCLHCPPWPPSMATLRPRAPMRLLPLGSSRPVPPASLRWQTLCKLLCCPLPPHPWPCLPPACQGCHRHRELAWCSSSGFPR